METIYRHNKIYKLPTKIGGIFIFLFIVLLSVFNIHENLFISGILLSIFLFYHIRNKNIEFNSLDITLILSWFYLIANQIISIDIIKSIPYIKIYTLSILFYFSIRIYCNKKNTKYLLYGTNLIILISCLIALFSFDIYKESIYALNFESLYDFKYKYRPFGYLSNVWGTFLILFIYIIIYTLLQCRNNKNIVFLLYLFISLIVFEIIVSFSRGVYLSLIICCLFFLYTQKIKKKFIYITIFLIPIFIYSYPYKNDILRTIKITETVSQQRSINNRISGTKKAINYALKNKGSGLGTYSMVLNDSFYETDNIEYSSFAPNLFSQILVEQGYLGLLFWTILVGYIILVFIKNNKNLIQRRMNYLLYSFFLIFLIRESTFSTFFEYQGIQLLFFLILAIHVNLFQKSFKRIKLSKLTKTIFCLFLIIISLFFSYITIYNSQNRVYNSKAISLLKENKVIDAIKYIEKTPHRIPYLINRGIIYINAFKINKNYDYFKKAEFYLTQASKQNPHDIMTTYYKTILYQEAGDLDNAIKTIDSLVERFPNKSLYNLGNFIINYDAGKKDKSLVSIVNAIKLSPKIVISPTWKKLTQKDSSFVKKTIFCLLENINKKNDIDFNPIDLSRQATLFFFLGKKDESLNYFLNVVSNMPNLSFPWFYLSSIYSKNKDQSNLFLKRFLFLNFNIKNRDLDNIVQNNNFQNDLFINIDFYNNNYINKFVNWYGEETIKLELEL